jgi:acetolactate synthase-1/2/3 large subunit
MNDLFLHWAFKYATMNFDVNHKGLFCMKSSDLLLKCLEAQDVKQIYGVPGEENADIMISLLDSPIEFIICRHEQEAAFMADMHGRLTGKPGVCLATLGPGATNLVTGLVTSNLDKVPSIGIIGQAATTRLHKESHQNMHAIPMFQPVTKWASSISVNSIIPEVVAKAFKLAQGAKPGAVVIELPEDVAKEDSEATPILKQFHENLGGAEKGALQEAVALIKASKKPLLLAGSGATFYECDSELKTFVEKTGLFVTTTFMGKGVLSDDHPNSLFTVGLGMKDIALEAFEEADLVITLGYDMIEWHPDRWNQGEKKTIIHIDTLATEVDQAYLPELELIGDLNVILEQLNANLGDTQPKEESFADLRNRIAQDLARLTTDDAFPMKPQRIIADLRAELDEHDILVSDVGAHKMWIARQYHTYHSRTCFIHNGFASMGGAMPGATMAKMLKPGKHVVALCGDGGFVMSIQALPTAVRYKVPITIVVVEDGHYGLIKWKQEAAFNRSSHVELHNHDLVMVAEAFGAHAIRVNETDSFALALKEARGITDKPTVIVVPIDYSENMKLTAHLGELVSR